MSAAERTGFIYFVQAVGGGPVKIGFATDVVARLKGLQCGSPVALKVVGCIPGSLADEMTWHLRFASDRLHGEWFTPSDGLRAEILRVCNRPVRLGAPELLHRPLTQPRVRRAKPTTIAGKHWPMARKLVPLVGERYVTSRELGGAIGETSQAAARVLSVLAAHGWVEGRWVKELGAHGWRVRASA